MKCIFIVLSFIFICSQHILISMDVPVSQSILSQKQIIDTINDKINTQYSPINTVFSMALNLISALKLSSEMAFAVIQITEQNCPQDRTDTKEIYDKLYKENSFFTQTIDYFVDRASDNLKLLTANNITTIEDPQKQQPITELNKLSLPIKTYVMNRALENINYTYDIILSGQHQDAIQAFDVCEVTDQAVTSSFNKEFYSTNYTTHSSNNRLLLWDLKTGNVIRIFNELSPIKLLKFSKDGSFTAAALYNENTVKVWHSNTGELLHKLSTDYSIDHLSYSCPDKLMLSATHDVHEEYSKITQWLLTDAKAGTRLNSSWIEDPMYYKPKRKYSIKTFKGNELHITKSDCASLALCIQALQNTITTEMIQKNIPTSTSFFKSTDLEQKKVHAAIQQKLSTSRKGKRQSLELTDLTLK